VGAAGHRRSGARTRAPTGPVCPGGGRSVAATHLVATAPRPRPALVLSVPRTAPTTSTADASVHAEVMQPPIETSNVSGRSHGSSAISGSCCTTSVSCATVSCAKPAVPWIRRRNRRTPHGAAQPAGPHRAHRARSAARSPPRRSRGLLVFRSRQLTFQVAANTTLQPTGRTDGRWRRRQPTPSARSSGAKDLTAYWKEASDEPPRLRLRRGRAVPGRGTVPGNPAVVPTYRPWSAGPDWTGGYADKSGAGSGSRGAGSAAARVGER
jgi:hypothetical protein